MSPVQTTAAHFLLLNTKGSSRHVGLFRFWLRSVHLKWVYVSDNWIGLVGVVSTHAENRLIDIVFVNMTSQDSNYATFHFIYLEDCIKDQLLFAPSQQAPSSIWTANFVHTRVACSIFWMQAFQEHPEFKSSILFSRATPFWKATLKKVASGLPATLVHMLGMWFQCHWNSHWSDWSLHSPPFHIYSSKHKGCAPMSKLRQTQEHWDKASQRVSAVATIKATKIPLMHPQKPSSARNTMLLGFQIPCRGIQISKWKS